MALSKTGIAESRRSHRIDRTNLFRPVSHVQIRPSFAKSCHPGRVDGRLRLDPGHAAEYVARGRARSVRRTDQTSRPPPSITRVWPVAKVCRIR
jgi:hypothetical protein